MAEIQSLAVLRRSASSEVTPQSSEQPQVAKLIDVSRCIGCKACQAACMEWNDQRPEVGTFQGTYDNPLDLSPTAWTVMRFTEWDNPKGDLEWLIRKDGCMHCAEPGCLEACPSPGACNTPTASSTSLARTASAAATASRDARSTSRA